MMKRKYLFWTAMSTVIATSGGAPLCGASCPLPAPFIGDAQCVPASPGEIASKNLDAVISSPDYPFRCSAYQDGVQRCWSNACGDISCGNYYRPVPWTISSNP